MERSLAAVEAEVGVWPRGEPARIDLLAAAGADSVKPLVDAVECTVDRSDFHGRRFAYPGNDVVVLSFDRLLGEIRVQRARSAAGVLARVVAALSEFGSFRKQGRSQLFEIRHRSYRYIDAKRESRAAQPLRASTSLRIQDHRVPRHCVVQVSRAPDGHPVRGSIVTVAVPRPSCRVRKRSAAFT